MNEANESFEETAKRETLEETGFEVQVVQKLHDTYNSHNGVTFHLFHCQIIPNHSDSRPDQEVVGTIWTNPSIIPPSGYRFPKDRELFIETFGKLAAQTYKSSQICD